MNIVAAPLEDAIARISAKTPVGSILKSADWANVPLALRERAFFSSAVESTRLLSEMQSKLQGRLAMTKEAVARGEAFVDRSSFIGDMRKLALDLGLSPDPALAGGLQDITSRKRLGLIFDIQDEQAKEFARWKAEQDPDILDAFPCQELIRIADRQRPRDWLDRWVAAGGRLFNGRMIARKDDPIWRAINRFGVPFPPFDYGSGMGLDDVGRDEAEELGVIARDAQVEPQEAAFNETLQASTRGISPRFVDALKNLFGDQVREADGALVWRGNLIGDLFTRAMAEPSFKDRVALGQASPQAVSAAAAAGEDIGGFTFDLSADDIRHVMGEHGSDAGAQRAVSKLDFETLPTVLREPETVILGNRPDTLVFTRTFAGRQISVWWLRGRKNRKAGLKTLYVKAPAK